MINATPVVLSTLADFKRFLKAPGATVQVVRNDWMNTTIHGNTGRTILQPKAGYFDPKTIAKVQSNSVQFTTGSWLQFPPAKAMKFHGDVVTIDMNWGDETGRKQPFAEVLEYRCHVVNPANQNEVL